jgi:shikimate dehydrogenase
MISEVPAYPRAGHRAAVLGRPISHTLSPVLHRAAYRALGLADWRYEAVDVAEPELPTFLAGCGPGWSGWSLTMPLKRAVRPLLVRESDLARDVGAVNTVLVAPDGLEGFNTDVHGIVEAFGECGVGPLPAGAGATRHATILGGGATAASALAALAELGCCEPAVHVRSVARTEDLQAAAVRLGVTLRLEAFDPATMARSIRRADLVVSTLPAGVADDLAIVGGFGQAARERRPVLLDVVYDPWPTMLAQEWTAAGAPAVGGFVMLVHQAYGQVHLMTGLRPPVDRMRAAGEAELRRRQLELVRRSGVAASVS